MRKTILVVFFAFIACFYHEVSALTWDEVLSLAQKNSSELKSAEKSLESYEWSYRKAYSAFLPQISASLSSGQTTASSGTTNSYSYGLSATQNLFNGFSNLNSLHSTYADLEYSRASLKNSFASVLYDVRSSYIELLTAQENLKLLQKISSQRKENSRLIELRYKSGREDKGNLMRTQADEAAAKYDLSSAKRTLELAKLKLSQLVLTEINSVEGTGINENIKKQDNKNLLLSCPTYLMAKYKLELAEINQRAAISEFLPSVSLSGSIRKSGENWPPDSKTTSISLNLSYSLFPGGSNFADWIIYNIKLDQAKEDFINSKNDTFFALEESYNNYNNALEALNIGKIHLEASKERARVARAKYLNGLILYDEWDRIENEYIGYQKQLLNHQKSAYLAEALWYKSYGGYVK